MCGSLLRLLLFRYFYLTCQNGDYEFELIGSDLIVNISILYYYSNHLYYLISSESIDNLGIACKKRLDDVVIQPQPQGQKCSVYVVLPGIAEI